MDARLKAIQTKSQWGSIKTDNNNNIINIADNEFVSAVGSRLVHIDLNNMHAKESNIIDMLNNDILYVQYMAISPDTKYLATVVKMKDSVEIDSYGQRTCNIYIYELKDRFRNLSVPRLIQHSTAIDEKDSKNKRMDDDLLEITCMAFSHDSKYFAFGTNTESNNYICYDYQRGKIFQKLTLESTLRSISFNPNDSMKCCTMGDAALFKFWRFTEKSVHAAPVVGLKIGVYAFTCHAWIPNADNHILAGTTEGFISLIQNCEQRVPIQYVTGSKQDFISEEKQITNILVRGEFAVVVTPTNCLAVYEVRKTIPSRGAPAANSKLIYLATFRLEYLDKLIGLQWVLKDTNTSYSMIAVSPTNTILFELSTENGMVSLAMQSDMNNAELNVATTKNVGTILRYEGVMNEKEISCNHCKSINSLSLSVRNHTFITTSFDEAILRVWDYNDLSSFNKSYLIEDYNKPGNTLNNPFHLDMHPSGLFVAFALENEIKEFGISDSQLDILRKINTKTAYVGPNGIPFNNNQPVSLVKYSNGGQFLAVVTGRVAQIYHCYMNSFDSSVLGGEPVKVMILFDHSAPITDLLFLQDDTLIVTTSSDGTVYEWRVGESARCGEYLSKEASALFVSATKTKLKNNTIIAYFTTKEDVTSIAASHVAKKKETEKLNRKMSTLPSAETIDIKKISSMVESGSPGQRSRSSFMERPIRASFLDSPNSLRKSITLNETIGNNVNTNGIVDINNKSQNFFAVWSGGRITSSPKIIQIDSPVKSIALGDTDGPDKLDICVIGLEDGRVLICTLPFPVRLIETTQTITTNLRVSSRSRLAVSSKKRYSISSNASIDNSTVITASTKSTAISKHPIKNTNSSGSLQLNLIPEENSSENGDDIIGSPLDKNSSVEVLNESFCRNFRLHVGAVNQVSISRDGKWIFTAGVDGCMFMLATSKKAKELTEIPHRSDILEDNFLVIDRTSIHTLRKNYIDTLHLIEFEKKESEMAVNKIAASKDKIISDLEAKMKKEIHKRDETIIQGRLDYLNLNNLKKEEINAIEKKSENIAHEIELMYERKLAQESLYLDKMRQAYDEYVIHSKLDLSETQRKAEQKLIDIENEKKHIQMETEKQKSTVLQYFDYVKIQNNEVLNGLEATQEEERYKLKEEIKAAKKAYQDAYNGNLAEQAKFNRKLHSLTTDIESKDMEVLKQKNDILWLNERISKLEESLTKATLDLKNRTDRTDEWESRGGELQQKIFDLERIRKTLTTQLHTLREELGPKEESLGKANDKLQEMEREYELALNAILEKDSLLAQKSMSMHLQQKQIRDLRSLSMRKDAIIKRVATVFDDYRFALKQAYFSSEKRTIDIAPINQNQSSAQEVNSPRKSRNSNGNGNLNTSNSATNLDSSHGHLKSGIVEIIAQNPEMKTAFNKLNDMLTPYLKDNYTDIELKDDVEAVRLEQTRHMQQLENTVARVKSSLDLVNEVASSKVHNHLNDNKTLLHEVNSLRTEVRNLSMDNQRLQATIDFMHMKQKQSINSDRNSYEAKKALYKPDRDVSLLKTDSFMDSTLSGTEPESFTPNNVKSLVDKLLFDDNDNDDSQDLKMSTSQQYVDHMKKYSNLNQEIEKKKPLTAEEKIAALIEMNVKEIKSISDKNNSLTSKQSSKKGKSLLSSSSEINKINNDKSYVQKVIGNATIELPPVILKKK